MSPVYHRFVKNGYGYMSREALFWLLQVRVNHN